jgi:D-serine deaminase-like pyridoxal phosphate-dependent protein
MLNRIQKPTLLLQEEICRKNIEKMAAKAKLNNMIFRPHFKTHQSIEIGEWFKAAGVSKITVSSVSMAQRFSEVGWDDITIAFPMNIRESSEIFNISEKCNLNVLITDLKALFFLQKKCKKTLGFFIKIDVGNHRVGFSPDAFSEIDFVFQIAKKNPFLVFQGFLGHAGQSYQAKNRQEILTIHKASCAIMRNLKKRYESSYPHLIVSLGDTPTCSTMNNFKDIDEIRPGNFVFFDEMQFRLGSCKKEEIAMVVACPVVAKMKSRNEVVIYGGAVHLSKESLSVNGEKKYGRVVFLHDNYWHFPRPTIWIEQLSQEHGILKVSENQFSKMQVGNLLGIIPIHSCLTAALYDCYYPFENRKIDRIE